MNKNDTLALILQQGFLPLFYHDDIEVCIGVVTALYKSGVTAVEFTNRGSYALANFRQLISLANERWQGLQLGIGTVLNTEDAKAFITEGAAFVVCPGVIPAVADVVNNANLLWIPGCFTATEIITAKENDAKLIKIFPGSLVGPSYITAIKEIFPGLHFMPTGGVEVNEENIGAWFRAGVSAVGLGSKVISKEMLANKKYSDIERIIADAARILNKVRFTDL